jgi:hypothetical protein
VHGFAETEQAGVVGSDLARDHGLSTLRRTSGTRGWYSSSGAAQLDAGLRLRAP